VFGEPLTRMVSFRLTPEEYGRLREVCVQNNVRSVSDAARRAIEYWLDHCRSSEPPEELSRQVERLHHQVEALTELVGRKAVEKTDSQGN